MMKVNIFGIAVIFFFLVFCFALYAQTTVVAEQVVLETSDNVKIYGTFYEADQNAPGVILLHMMNRSRKDWGNFIFDLAEKGFSVLTIDLRGHGQSIEKTDGTKLFHGTFSKAEFKDMVKDVDAAIKFLHLKKIDRKRIAIVGASIGANVAINYAADNPGAIKGVTLLSPGLNYRDVKCTQAMEKYTGPVFIAASRGDKYAYKSFLSLSQINKPRIKTEISEGSYHGTNLFIGIKGFEQQIADWLEKKVKN